MDGCSENAGADVNSGDEVTEGSKALWCRPFGDEIFGKELLHDSLGDCRACIVFVVGFGSKGLQSGNGKFKNETMTAEF